jgi:hypothetical protein
MTAPRITGVFDFLCDFVLVLVPLAFISSAGTLREVLIRYEKIEASVCTYFRANGANIAPCAGLIGIIAT